MIDYETHLSIVLRSADYRENDRMLTLLTKERGKISALARGCRKPGNPLFGMTEVFVCSEFGFYRKNGRYTITQGVLVQNFYGIRKRLDAMLTASVVTEACELAGTEQPNARLFALLANVLFALDRAENQTKPVFVFFVIKLLDIIGMRPITDRCVCCGKKRADKINMALGGAVCEACPGERVPPRYFSQIETILSQPSKHIARISLEADDAFVLFCARWLASGIMYQPKSLKVMLNMLKT